MGSDEIKCYANPAIAALFEACPDHEICNRCGCCDQTWESCQACGGDGFIEMDDDDEWGDDDTCGDCDGAGGWSMCLGRCDKNGVHVR